MKYVKFTKKALNSLKREKEFSDRLSRRVINDLLSNAYTTSDLKYHMEDIAEFGCSGGNVMSLVYYSETERFGCLNIKVPVHKSRNQFFYKWRLT